MSLESNVFPARVVIVDDEPAIRESMTRLLQAVGHDAVAFDCAEAFLVAHGDDHACDCLLLDVSLPGVSGIDLARRLNQRPGAPQIIMISGRSEVPQAVEAMKSGASDFLLKPLASEDVLSSVRTAIDEHRASAAVVEARHSASDRVARLTRREREVLELIVTGRLNKQMAVELGISQKTVEFHRARVMRKLMVTCMAELMRVAFLGGVRDLHHELVSAEPGELLNA